MKPARGFAQVIIVAIVALVGAVAMLGYQRYAQKPAPAPTPTSSTGGQTQTSDRTSPSPIASDETANWKTFNGNGYTIKYPDFLTFAQKDFKGVNGGIVKVEDLKDSKYTISIYSSDIGTITGLEFNSQYEEKAVIIDETNSKKLVSVDSTLVQISFEKNAKSYTIVYTSGTQKVDKGLALFDQILSTFRFI